MKRILTLFILLPLLSHCSMARPEGMLKHAFSEDLSENERLVRSGEYGDALDDLSMLLEMDPKNERARFSRAVALQKMDRDEEAIEDYEILVKQNPNAHKALYNLGMLYAFKYNDNQKALQTFDRFLTLQPESEEAFRVAKIMVSIDEDGFTESQERNKEIVERSTLIESPSERRRLLTKAQKMEPDSSLFEYLIGQTFEAEGNSKMAAVHYELATSKQPTCAVCQKSMGTLLIQSGDATKGKAYLMKARLFEPYETETGSEMSSSL